MNIFSKNCVLLLSAFGLAVLSATPAEARLVYSTEEDGVHAPAFYLNQDDTSDDFVDLNFGASAGAQLRYDVVNDKFFLNRDLDLEASELQDFKVERLAVAPTCDVSNEGRMYFNSVAGQTYVCDGTVFNPLENDGLEKFTYKGELDAGSDTLPATANVGDLYLINGAGDNLGDIEGDDDLSVGDVVFFSNQNNNGDATDTQNWIPLQRNDDDAATQAFVAAVTLEQGTQNTNIGNNAAALAALATVASSGDYNDLLNLPTLGTAADNAETDFATAAQGTLADSALQSGDNVSELVNDAGYITTDTDTTYSAGTGLTLTGTTFSNDLGTDIDDTELDFGSVTLSDFTNDAGFVTTDNDTTYTGSGGITLTGTNFTADLGTTVETGEITDGTITFADLNSTDITLSDFTNDAGFVTTDNDTTYSAGTGMNLVGTTFSTTLGTSIGIAELENGGSNQVLTTTGAGVPQWENKSNFATSAQGALADSALQSGDNVSELTNDAGYITTDSDTTYSAGTGITLTGTTFSNDLGTDIATGELQDDAVTSAKVLDATLTADDLADDSVSDAEINYTTVTLSDFTNDAGFVTTDNDTTYTGSGGITLTGTNFTADLGTTVETGEITDGTITFADLNSTDITLSDFTNDAGFVTTDNDTTYSAGTGITLTGTTFSNDLGSDIDVSEIVSAGVGDADKVLTTSAAGVPQWEVKSNFATAAQGALADSALQSGDNVSELVNDAGYLTTDSDTLDGLSCALNEVAKWNGSAWVCATDAGGSSYSAGTGLTLTGTTFSNDLGTTIDSSEIANATIIAEDIATDAITTVKLDDGAVTNSKIAVDAVTSDEIDDGTISVDDMGFNSVDSDQIVNGSVDTNELATDAVTAAKMANGSVVGGTGGTIQDGSITAADLAFNSVDSDEIVNGAVDTNELATDAVTAAKMANGSVVGGTGGTIQDGSITAADLAFNSVDSDEIATNAVSDLEIDYSSVTLSDFTNDAGFITSDTDTTYSAGTGLTLTGTTFSNDLGTDIDDTELDFGSVTLSDFTNDAGFITTDNDTTYSAGTGITLTGTTFSNDLGTSIETGEIGDNQVTLAKMADGGANQVLTTDGSNNPQWEDKTIFATAAQGTLADSALQSGDNVSELTNDAGYVTTDNDTTYSAGTGITLTGTTFSNDLGTDIATGELQDDAVTSAKVLDGTLTADDIANNEIDGTKIALGSDAAGDVMYYNGTDWTRLPVGSAGDVLQVNGTADAPVWSGSTATKYQFIDIFGCVRGSASAGTVGGGNSAVIRFDAGGNSQMRCALPVPSDWQTGTDINIETYYSPSDNTNGDVSFVLRHAAFGIGETISGGAFTDTLTGPETIASNTQLDIYELTGDIPAATLAADDMININLRRQPGDAADTYTGDINIHQIRISYTGKELQ